MTTAESTLLMYITLLMIVMTAASILSKCFSYFNDEYNFGIVFPPSVILIP